MAAALLGMPFQPLGELLELRGMCLGKELQLAAESPALTQGLLSYRADEVVGEIKFCQLIQGCGVGQSQSAAISDEIGTQVKPAKLTQAGGRCQVPGTNVCNVIMPQMQPAQTAHI